MPRATVGHLRSAAMTIRPGSEHAARDRHRVIAGETGPIDFRIGGEGDAVADIVELPNRAVEAQLELRLSHRPLVIGEIGPLIEAAERQAGVRIDQNVSAAATARDGAKIP